MSKTWRDSITMSRFLTVSNLVLTAALFMALGKLAGTHERIVVIPPAVDKKVILSWDSATPDYHKSMAYYLTGVIASAAPKNVDFVASIVERFASPEIATDLVRKVRAAAVSIDPRTQHQVAWFEGSEIKWEEESGRVFVIGTLAFQSGASNTKSPAVFEFKFHIAEGRPQIVEFDSYQGSTPHTLAWREDFENKQRAQAEKEAERAARRQGKQ